MYIYTLLKRLAYEITKIDQLKTVIMLTITVNMLVKCWPTKTFFFLVLILLIVRKFYENLPNNFLLNWFFANIFVKVYDRATQLADRGLNPDLSSIKAGPQASG